MSGSCVHQTSGYNRGQRGLVLLVIIVAYRGCEPRWRGGGGGGTQVPILLNGHMEQKR